MFACRSRGRLSEVIALGLWTTARIAVLIKSELGVSYHPDHIGRLMHDLGWTPQKSERRALERNKEEIERWKQKE